MKKLIYTFMCCLLSMGGWAQEADYRPFIEEGKVWTLESSMTGAELLMENYYFDGDTIVGGQSSKKMMCDMRVSEENVPLLPDIWDGKNEKTFYVGAFREEGKRVFFAKPNQKEWVLLYDFGANVGDEIEVYATSLNKVFSCTITGKTAEGTECFKGNSMKVIGDIPNKEHQREDIWMEGVGGRKAPDENLLYYLLSGNYGSLITCTVGGEVLYLDSEWEKYLPTDEGLEGKKRVDFTHVVKNKPKSPQRKAGEKSLSAEYSSKMLTLDLGTLSDAYVATIKDPSDKEVYSKEVKANSVLALNIDISTYARANYTITLENQQELFTGLFHVSESTAIQSVSTSSSTNDTWYDLMGRPLKNPLHKGIYIRGGKKVLLP